MRRLLIVAALLATPAVARADGLPGTAGYPPTYYLGGCSAGGAFCLNTSLVPELDALGNFRWWRQVPVCGGAADCGVVQFTLYDAAGNFVVGGTGAGWGGSAAGAVTGVATIRPTLADGTFLGPVEIPITHITTTPEPATMVLMGSGLVGLLGAARRRRFVSSGG